jgi:hypothetical protein
LGPWLDYKSHFDACSEINHWSDKEKGLYLAVSLRGQAQGVLGNLPLESRQDFKELELNCMPNGIVEIDGSRLFYPQPHVSINQ